MLVLNLDLRWSERRPLELVRFAFVRWRQGVIVGAAATPGLGGAGWKFGHVRRNIQRSYIKLVLGGGGLFLPPNQGHDQQRDHQDVQTERDGLRPAKVLVLGPDILNLDRLNARRKSGLFRGRKEFLDPAAEPAEVSSPIHGQAAVHRALGHWPRTEKVFQIFVEAATILVRHQS